MTKMFLFLTSRYYADEISRRQTKKPLLDVLFYTCFLKQIKMKKVFYFVNLLNLASIKGIVF